MDTGIGCALFLQGFERQVQFYGNKKRMKCEHKDSNRNFCVETASVERPNQCFQRFHVFYFASPAFNF